jgi:hypothetical protein
MYGFSDTAPHEPQSIAIASGHLKKLSAGIYKHFVLPGRKT